jgi:predicted nucleic acid-binding protein
MLLLDTDIMIEISRKSPQALAWLQSLGATEIGLPGLVVMELIQGCRNNVEQRKVQRLINHYNLF